MDINLGRIIKQLRAEQSVTQEELAEYLGISFQAVSKWESGTSYPDIEMLPRLASLLGTTIDGLLDYPVRAATVYEERYKTDDYYWGLAPNDMCYEIMRLRPPVRPYRVLDIGCGEGKDAVFLAKNGYIVTAFDIAQSGLDKAMALADRNGVHIDLFRADIKEYRPAEEYDIIFSSGVFCYLPEDLRAGFIGSLKEHTSAGGLNAVNVFVEKPFIKQPPDREKSESYNKGWLSGELFTYYNDWYFHKTDEVIFDCNSSGTPHQHCMDILIAEKKGYGVYHEEDHFG